MDNFSKATCTIILLAILIVFSAWSVIYIQAKNRQLFSTFQSLQQKRDKLYLQWGQLLLEQSTWSTQARIQHIATQQLNMQMPKQKAIVMVPMRDSHNG